MVSRKDETTMTIKLEARSNSTNGYNTDILKDMQEFKIQQPEREKKPFDPVRIHYNSTNGYNNNTLKDIQELKIQKPESNKKTFDLIKTNSKRFERLDQANHHKNVIQDFTLAMEEIYSSSKRVINKRFYDKIKTLEEEKKEIEKKLDQEKLKLEAKDGEKQQPQDRKKKTDGEIAESKKDEKQKLQDRKEKIDQKIAELEKKKEEETKKLSEQMLSLFKTSDVIEKTKRLMGTQFKLNITVQSIAWAYSGIGQVDQAFQDFMKTALKLLLEGKF